METLVKAAREASFRTAVIETEIKNRALLKIAEALQARRSEIEAANGEDMRRAAADKLTPALVDRLRLDGHKIDSLVTGLKSLAELPDPVGAVQLKRELDTGLVLERIAVPIGVIGVIFEARPEAFIQIAALCIKSGNAVILKGGKEAASSVRLLNEIVNDALAATDSRFEAAVQSVASREEVNALLKFDRYIDLMIPRGSNRLVRSIIENTKIPVLGHADGLCHTYVDADADIAKAVRVVTDAKCQYPAACNATETVLVHSRIAPAFLPALKAALDGKVELRGCPETLKLISVNPASDDDWDEEYNDLILSVKIVSSAEEAIEFINRHGSRHTDAVLTENSETAALFLRKVDSASVYHNCSTRFADGFRYGFGAEVGISTHKIHARGPVGLEGLTIYKYLLHGDGQIVGDYVSGKSSFHYKDLK
ncbi:MAG: glutamate-5-semialdehyde dehydrogenase [Spirochaetia bacterium]|nr:glutamate-5-semialdehyde dehydrogenase [Spirochaetia bacterium]